MATADGIKTAAGGVLAALLTLAAGMAHAGPGSTSCLPYAPDEAKVSGTLSAETYAGPPNYESIERGDLPQTAFILTLDKPVCVSGSSDPQNAAAAERNLTKIQIGLPADGALRKRMRLLMGKAVSAQGALTHTTTTHDRASVVMELTEIDPGPGVVMEAPKKPASDKPPKVKKDERR